MFEKNADGSGPEKEIGTKENVRQVVAWDWSRDGKFLLVRGENELWYYAPLDRQSKPYVHGQCREKRPVFTRRQVCRLHLE